MQIKVLPFYTAHCAQLSDCIVFQLCVFVLHFYPQVSRSKSFPSLLVMVMLGCCGVVSCTHYLHQLGCCVSSEVICI